jgi:predicted O-linked N-acetylglucosamine transferase (SPINDLY family)
VQIRPDYAEAWNNRGITLRSRGRPAEALESYERALQIRPDYAEVYHNRGVALQDLKRVDEALLSYTQALALNPALDWVPGLWVSTRMQTCEWSGFDGRLEELLAGVAAGKKVTPPFAVIGLSDSLVAQRQVAATWVVAKYPERKQLPAIAQRPRRERIRLGYYSADFHEHATAYLIAELFERHDRQRFELVAVSFGPDSQDPMRRRLVAAADEFIDVRTQSASEIALLSRSMAIDIAVDLKGFTQDSRTGIFAHRAAPIQVSYLGYPGTLGAPYIDYLIADHTLVPEASRTWYSEKIAYLPDSYQVNDRQRPISERALTREQLGLPPAGFVWCCFNNNYKITPRTFDGWMRLLGQVPDSVLWLLQDNATAAANLRREAQRRGVAAERLVFAPRMPLAEHLARHRHADLFLDTLPCNAHTTASDALWAGLPVLTLAGEGFAARVAASLLEAVGLPELVADTQARYEEVALALATEPARLAALRARLHDQRLGAPLFDTDRFARHIENAYLQMHERYHAGLGPEHLFVTAS